MVVFTTILISIQKLVLCTFPRLGSEVPLTGFKQEHKRRSGMLFKFLSKLSGTERKIWVLGDGFVLNYVFLYLNV
jgi:hypothetical protein